MTTTILVVDDDELQLALIEMAFFEVASVRVRTVLTGAEALEVLETDPVDILVADLQMPGMDGIQLVRLLAERGFEIGRAHV